MSDPAVEDLIVAATEKKIERSTHHTKGSFMEENEEKHSVSRRRHLFGRQKPLHAALGSGKTADILLWRHKQMSGAILVSATVIWLLFEWIGYHLLPFLCHFLILTLAILFLWSNLSSFVNKSPPNFPDIRLSQELCDSIALILKDQINQACLFLREMTSGKDLKRFMSIWWMLMVKRQAMKSWGFSKNFRCLFSRTLSSTEIQKQQLIIIN
ncbi:Reticulon, partial [Cynara cardunculus var. scolymus]